MAAVKVSDGAVKAASDLRVKAATPEEQKKSKKAVIFRLSDDLKSIIVDEGKEILVGDCDDTEDVFQKLRSKLPKDECRYVAFNVTYETHENLYESLVFILWVPESAPLRNKMIYESSKSTLRQKIVGVKHEYQVNTHEELCDRKSLVNKLRVSDVNSLEGKPV